MPVATQAAIKGLTTQQMESLGVTLILNNTYHLNLRPGIKILNETGGAHKFQGWNRNLLTVIHITSFWGIILSFVGQWRLPTRFSEQIYNDHRGRCTLPGSVHRRTYNADSKLLSQWDRILLINPLVSQRKVCQSNTPSVATS